MVIHGEVSELGLTFHWTHNRSFRGRFLPASEPNQQCQGTEGQAWLYVRCSDVIDIIVIRGRHAEGIHRPSVNN